MAISTNLSADLFDQRGLFPYNTPDPLVMPNGPPPRRIPNRIMPGMGSVLPLSTVPDYQTAQAEAREPQRPITGASAAAPQTEQAPAIDVSGKGFLSGYTDEITKSQKRINDLENATVDPLYSQEQIKARGAENQRMQQLGMVGLLSGDKYMGAIGGMVLKTALANKQPHVTEQGMYDYNTGEYKLFPQVARAKQIETERKNLERLQGDEARARATWQENRIRSDERAEAARLRAADANTAREDRKTAAAGQRDQSNEFRRYGIEDTGAARFDLETKDYATEIQATNKIKQIVQESGTRKLNPIEQQTVAVLLQKFLDPTSVVRETEYSRASEAAGLTDRALNYYDKISKGEFLPPQTIHDIQTMASMYQDASQQKINRIGDQYYEIAKRRGLNADNIVRSPWYQTPERRAQLDEQRNRGAKPPGQPQDEAAKRARLEELRRRNGGGQ